MPKSTHFLWELYLALANQGGRSEPEGRAAIKALLPSYASIVDEVVSARGDVSKLSPEVMEAHEQRMSEEAQAIGNQSLNAQIREPRSGGKATLSGSSTDMNAQIRAFRDSGRMVLER